MALDEKSLTFQKYMTKNIGNAFSFALYFTMQDIAFIIAIPIMNPDFSSTMKIVCFALGVFFAVVSVAYMVWCFIRINCWDP